MATWRRALAGIGAAVLLAACGGNDDGGDESFADESPETITAEAEQAMRDTSSMRIDGFITDGGQEISVDMAVTTAGDCEGTMGIAEGEAQVISVGGTTYMKPDEAFWRTFGGSAAEMIIELVGDSWAIMPGDEGMAGFCDLDRLLEDLDAAGEGDDDPAEVLGVEEVDGRRAVRLAGETDSGDPVTVWIAIEAPHHIVKMEVTQGDEPGTITFSDFDEDFGIEAPPEDEVVDLENAG